MTIGTTAAELGVTLTGQALRWPGLPLSILVNGVTVDYQPRIYPIVWKRRRPGQYWGLAVATPETVTLLWASWTTDAADTDTVRFPRRQLDVARPFQPPARPVSLPRSPLEHTADRLAVIQAFVAELIDKPLPARSSWPAQRRWWPCPRPAGCRVP